VLLVENPANNYNQEQPKPHLNRKTQQKTQFITNCSAQKRTQKQPITQKNKHKKHDKLKLKLETKSLLGKSLNSTFASVKE
jgi:hypothetical protein